MIARYLNARPLRVALGCNLVLFSLTYLICTPRFLFNDDPMMMLLAAGVGRVTESSVYLNYSSVLLGWALEQLYSITLGFPWYALYLILGLFAAYSAFLYLILKRQPGLSGLVLFVAYFCLVALNLLINLQFTIVSILVSIAGFLLLLEGSGAGGEPKPSRLGRWLSLSNAAGLLLVLFGSLIRFDGMALGCLLATPFLVLCLGRGRFSGMWSAATLWGLGLALSFGLQSLNSSVYAANPDSQDFLERNLLAGQFLNDGAHLRVDQASLERIIDENNWSMNDFAMFQSWFLMNEELYSVDSMGAMLAKLPTRNVQLTRADVLKSFEAILQDEFVRTCLLFLFGMALLFAADLRSGLWIAAVLLLVAALISYLILFVKPPPDRLYFAMFSYLALLPLLRRNAERVASLARAGLLRKGLALAALLVCLVRGSSAFSSYMQQSQSNARSQHMHRTSIEALAPSKEQLYFAWTGAAAWQFVAPFGDLEFLRGLVAPDSRQDPSTKLVLRHFGIDDIYLALATRDEVFLLLQPRHAARKLQLYRQYMLEHHGLEVEWECSALNQVFEAYDIKIVSEPERSK